MSGDSSLWLRFRYDPASGQRQDGGDDEAWAAEAHLYLTTCWAGRVGPAAEGLFGSVVVCTRTGKVAALVR